MKTLDEIIAVLTTPAMLDDLAGLLRRHNPGFWEDEEKYKQAVALLKAELDSTISPSLGEYLQACQTEVIANLLYAAYLGYRANLENFRAPCMTNFVSMDFTDYIRDHLMGHFPVCNAAACTKEAFLSALPKGYHEVVSDISQYFAALDVSGPKIAHYVGYMISNRLLPWVEPGYRVDCRQTFQYQHELEKYMGYLPL